jgi:hypothetical protein
MRWANVADSEREAALEITPELAAELDKRWAEHIKYPDAAVPWSEVQR